MPDRNVVAIVQARMGSSRLPDKVALDIGGQPMLARVVDRTRRASLVDNVIVATTTQAPDDRVEKLCQAHGYPCFRGNPFDLLDRYYQAACLFDAHVIVRITADCPLIDPGVIDQTIGAFFGELKGETSTSSPDLPWDFAANRLPPPWKRTYPIGLDTEVCTFAALRHAWQEADQPYQREHVMPYLYESVRSKHFSTLEPIPSPRDIPPGYFRVLQVDHDPDYGSYRWTVDTPTDLELARTIYAYFGNQDLFSWLDVLALFQRRPELASINAGVQHKTMRDVDTRRQEAS
jgi:spore coat polysaccharide biosynthesis protein SpsF